MKCSMKLLDEGYSVSNINVGLLGRIALIDDNALDFITRLAKEEGQIFIFLVEVVFYEKTF